MRSLAQYEKQALSGAVIAVKLILAILTLGLLLAGSAALAGNHLGPMGKAEAYVGFAVGLGVVVATIEKWRQWLFAFIGVRGVIGGLCVLASGRGLVWPYTPVPRYQSFLLLLFSVALIAISYPLLNMRKRLEGIDRALLVGSLIAFCLSLVQRGEVGIWIWASICVVLMAVFRARNKPRSRHYRAQSFHSVSPRRSSQS